MTNHVHLVIEPTEDGGGLSEIMKSIHLAYASIINVDTAIRDTSGRTGIRASSFQKTTI